MFNKIHRPSRIYNEVALQIEEAIIAKKFDIGDRLPSERELAETFDVSRRTLRESLRVVEQKGLIEIRPAVDNNKPLDNKKSPTNTAILFFHKALIEKKPLLLLLPSTTSS